MHDCEEAKLKTVLNGVETESCARCLKIKYKGPIRNERQQQTTRPKEIGNN